MLGTKWRCNGVPHVFSKITVEPLISMYLIANAVCELATQNLNLDKACRVNLKYGDEVCNALNRRETANYTREEKEVQKLVSEYAGYGRIIQSIMVGVLVLIWGSWSDKHKRRKPVILIPLLSELCRTLGQILCTYFKNSPVEVTIFVEMVVPSFGGGWVVILMAVYSYIADITTEEDRTFRIGLANTLFHVAYPIGASLSGILIRLIGFYGVFSISSILFATCFLYALFFIKEPSESMAAINGGMKVEKSPEDESTTNTLSKTLKDFFDVRGVKECVKVVLKKDGSHKRLKIIFLMLIIVFSIGPLMGEWVVFYLFTRYKFNWSEVEFSIYTTFSSIIGSAGSIFGSVVLAKWLRMDDALIAIIASTMKVFSSIMFGTASTVWAFALASVMEILHGNCIISMRSIATKLVSPHELGKMNAVIGSIEALVPFIAAPVYARTYAATLDSFPGTFFFLTAVSMLISTFIFCALYYMNRKERQRALEITAEPQTTDCKE